MSEGIFSRAHAGEAGGSGDGVFVPSGHARGPWEPGAMHGGAPAALLVRAIERVEAPAPMLVARLSMEFLRAVPLVPLTAEASVVRPGRRLQLVEAVLRAEGEEVCRARATLLRREAVEVPEAALPVPSLAPPEEAEPITESLDGSTDESFAVTGMEIRVLGGGFSQRGPATAWFRLRRQVVEGEEPSPAQRAVAAGDFGNGIAAEVEFATHVFVNTDLTVHLSREPVGEWIGLDSRTEHGPEGTALARSTLHDALGPCGLAAQSLYVAAR